MLVASWGLHKHMHIIIDKYVQLTPNIYIVAQSVCVCVCAHEPCILGFCESQFIYILFLHYIRNEEALFVFENTFCLPQK